MSHTHPTHRARRGPYALVGERLGGALLAGLLTGACVGRAAGPEPAPRAAPAEAPAPPPAVSPANAPPLTPAELARRDGGIPPYTRADVAFMTGMIGHHAQAVRMARWAPTHGANASLSILAERIAVSQEDEIAFMQRWLTDRKEAVPSADEMAAHAAHTGDAAHAGHAGMGAGASGAMMPGMLTADELATLDAARGTAFDRLFLTYMIRHHEGALTMVQQLLASAGSAQDDDLYKFVADVNVDQDTEIARMRRMLDALPPLTETRP